MRAFGVVLFLIHALIHGLGFAQAFSPASVPGMRGELLWSLPAWTVEPLGLVWLSTALGLAATATLLVRRSPDWWRIGAMALVLSQTLIVVAWPEAKFGTAVNVVLAFGVVTAASIRRFELESSIQLERLLAGVPEPTVRVTRETLTTLPEPVQRWLVASGVVGQTIPRTIHLKQSGMMTTAPGQRGMHAQAKQVFRTDPPSFLWMVEVTAGGILPIVGRDSLVDGHGRMLIKALGLFPIVDASDEKIDQGTLLRYLGEIVWFPAAAVSPDIRWETLSANSARATITRGDLRVSADFTFDERGRMTLLEAERYFGSGAAARLQKWQVKSTEWKTFAGVEVPCRGEVLWDLETGPFSYFAWTIEALEYDRTPRAADAAVSGSISAGFPNAASARL